MMKFRASRCYWSQGQFRDKASPRPLDRVVPIGATYRISVERAAGHVREVREGNRENQRVEEQASKQVGERLLMTQPGV